MINLFYLVHIIILIIIVYYFNIDKIYDIDYFQNIFSITKFSIDGWSLNTEYPVNR